MEPFQRFLVPALKIMITLLAIAVTDRTVRTLITRYSTKTFFHTVSPGLAKALARGFIVFIGLLILLDSIGISITPILASLGIGSLAIGLALQDTLSNLFSGLYVAIDKPAQVGDFVRLETGQEGYVTDVGWRSTRIQALSGNIVIISNNKLTNSIVTNFHLPQKDIAVLVECAVHYASDLNQVEKVVNEVASQVMKNTIGTVREFEPFIRYHTFGDSGICFTVILRAKEFVDQYLIKHEFIKKLHERFKKEGILIPYPTRTLEISSPGTHFPTNIPR